jgi:V-type H+-transporting ATPase subunit H
MTQSSNHEDPKALLTSAVVASIIAFALTSSTKTSPKTEEAIPKLNTYLSGLASSSDSGLQDVAVQEYAAILRSHKSRQLFWEQRKQTVNPLMEILHSAAGSFKDTDSVLFNGNASVRTTATEIRLGGGVGLQLLYHVLLVFWQLSFDGGMIGEGLDEYVSIKYVLHL